MNITTTVCNDRRGLEFSNTPFPTSLRDSVKRGEFLGQPCYDWIDAKGAREYAYRVEWNVG